jgi:hypothetical protein
MSEPLYLVLGQANAASPKAEEGKSGTNMAPSSVSPDSYTEIVPDGDLVLEVSDTNTETEHYLVCSQVLCATSEVFMKMLGSKSNFSEAVALRESRRHDEAQPVVVRLEGDDPSTMKIILYVLHAQYHRVKRKITIETMVHAAVICDKYGLHKALQLISESWSSGLKAMTKTNPEDWLLISWVFGPESVFTEVSRILMLSGSSDPEHVDELVFGERKRTLDDCLPSAVSC